MRWLIVVVMGGLGAMEAAAQSPVVLTSSVESGWTSNATENRGGTADFYLRHSHDLSITGRQGPLSLRGGLMLEQEVFRFHAGENDLSVTGGIEAGLALGEGRSLRLGYALTQTWTGEMVDLGPAMLALNSPALEHEMLGEIIVTGPDRAVTIGVDAKRRQPGLSRFEGLPLPPSRIDPELGQVTARIDGEWVLTPEMAGLARFHWTMLSVPDGDRVQFGREPASAARMAAGLRLRQGSWSVQARAGLDLVWPEAAPHLLRRLPHIDAAGELALTERLTLNARAVAGVELFNPVDGVAGRQTEAELGARLALTETLSLSAGLAVSREQGLYDESLIATRRSLHGAVSRTFAPGIEGSFKASHAEVEEPGNAYGVTTIGLTLAGRV
ncbi:hypothetical protein O9Z70_09700 [Devosia sp. YIM 151766]|uniref:hypothetical protein n=1 Tax=Devosia sp. YIM 151766 TaxID=3017325 RepID=UPI00255C9E41|nr:hypothetical protein [Devosia sp. YIM 151766]WIY51761.1 hypothetical protein O9Z70_09700 [Devosia sp. YIM 151766]